MTAIVHFDVQIDPARRGEAARYLSETLAATRAWPGNQGIEAMVDDADPCHILVVETWATAQDHDDYAAWRQTPEGKNTLHEILAAPPSKQVYSATMPLDL
ncbi:putative quinol monooxygenase [Pseudarthrobacter sp. C4D7]|uniref:putative quinol monooxygenase n=1 Tax=Pseudarthrobacter sp. C4D7 TaxID=2735268 RepID=UPI0015845150|nr:antibiotic biosynthesis monooxygenase family protein [Pseudarthrobacter sp. C4D7]NUT70280.1 monooxygenase [Pseudarthrobacter sp. C4D7]